MLNGLRLTHNLLMRLPPSGELQHHIRMALTAVSHGRSHIQGHEGAYQSKAQPIWKARISSLCNGSPMGMTRNTKVISCKCATAGVPVRASGGDGGAGGPRAFPPTAEEDEGQGPCRRLYPLWLGLLYSATRVAPAGALFKRKKKQQPETLDDFSGRIVKLYWPIMANLGFSGAIGLACGLALRAVGQALAVALGILFIVIQGGAYMGFVEVKWNNVHKDVIRRFDVNRSGTFDASDFKSILASGLAVLSQGVPSVGGFLTGFALGVK